MIKIVARMKVKGGCVDQFKEIAKDLIAKSRAEEGNVFYTLNESIQTPNMLTFIECWKDQDAVKSHSASEHFTGSLPRLGELCEESLPIELYNELEI